MFLGAWRAKIGKIFGAKIRCSTLLKMLMRKITVTRILADSEQPS